MFLTGVFRVSYAFLLSGFISQCSLSPNLYRRRLGVFSSFSLLPPWAFWGSVFRSFLLLPPIKTFGSFCYTVWVLFATEGGMSVGFLGR